MAFRWKDLMIDVLPEGLWAAGCNVGSCVSPSQLQSDCPNPSCAAPACAKGTCKASTPNPKKRLAGEVSTELLALREQLAERLAEP